jgi:spore coat polysaccharide biosynthesis protein SpsF
MKSFNDELPAIILIQARMNSSRLPGKVLLKFGNKTALHLMVDRIRTTKINEIIVASTTNRKDIAIEEECSKNIKVKCFRGDENNVIKRMIDAATKWGLPNNGIIVDLSGDCPFIDRKIVEYLLYKIRSMNLDYVHNDIINRSWPDGVDCQIYRLHALKEAYKLITNPIHYAHSGWNIPTYCTHLIESWCWIAPKKYSWPTLGLTLDEEKDYLFLKSMYERFSDKNRYPQPFSVKTMIGVLKRCPNLVTNMEVKRKVSGNG